MKRNIHKILSPADNDLLVCNLLVNEQERDMYHRKVNKLWPVNRSREREREAGGQRKQEKEDGQSNKCTEVQLTNILLSAIMIICSQDYFEISARERS